MNKIASVERLLSVEPHSNADRLDVVKVLGYQCVTERGLHKEGDLIIYIQPDSVLPVDAEWAEGYRKYSPGRIKAVKLRGEWSEGIIVKFEQVQDKLILNVSTEGFDVAELLGITHYEPPAPQDLSAKGLLPFGIPKTDEERWENMVGRLPIGYPVDVTLKVDGQSWSAYYNVETKEFGVLGRTMEYKEDAQNKYTAQIERYDIKRKLINYCELLGVSLCIRGESYGEGIQSFDKNPHSKEKPGLAIFSVYNIKERKYARPGDQHYFIDLCANIGLPTVPILERNVILTRELVDKYSTGIKKIDGKPFEGVVINHGAYTLEKEIRTIELPDGTLKDVGGTMEYVANSFKIISKEYDANK
jgi:RNA ligase (TIGR02306 family)